MALLRPDIMALTKTQNVEISSDELLENVSMP